MQIIYNGVGLSVVAMDSIRGEAVYDDSGTDYLYTKYTLSCVATVSGAVQVALTAVLPPVNSSSTANSASVNVPVGSVIPVPPSALVATTATDPTAIRNNATGPVSTVNDPTIRGPSQNRMSIGYNRSNTAVNHYSERRTASPGGPDAGFPPGTPEPPVPFDAAQFGQELPLTEISPNSGIVPRTDLNKGIYAHNERQIYSITPASVSPLTTWKSIRERLMQPRGQLWVFDGYGNEVRVLFQVPEWGFRTDCKNGPIPLVCEWRDAIGTVSAAVEGGFAQLHWACEFYVNESFHNGVLNPDALLSNRFTMRHVVDENSYLSLSVEGVAHFRTDFLYRLAINPDRYRPVLFLPIPQGFIRSNIQVEGLPDVTGVRYSYSDVQVKSNFTAGPYAKASSITAFYRSALLVDGDVLGGALSATERMLNINWLENNINDQGNPARPSRGPKRLLPPNPAPGP